MTQISNAKPASGKVIGGIVMAVIGVILLFNALPALFSNLGTLAQWATIYGLERAIETTLPYFILPVILVVVGLVLIRSGWRMLRTGTRDSRAWATQQAQRAGQGIEQRVSQAQRGGSSAVQRQASRAGQMLDQRAPGWRQTAAQVAGTPNAAWAQQQGQQPKQQQRRQPPPPQPNQRQQPGRAQQARQQVAQTATQVVQAAQAAAGAPVEARRPRVQEPVRRAHGSVLTRSSLTTDALTATSLTLNSLAS